MVIKPKKKIIIISSIIVVCILSSYGVYEFLIPSITLSPRPTEQRERRKALYNIEQIVLIDINNSSTEQNIEMNISEFRELIPYIKCENLLISKGLKINGNIRFKNGKKGTIIIDNMYGSFQYACEGENKGFYYFKEEEKQRMVDLIEKTINR